MSWSTYKGSAGLYDLAELPPGLSNQITRGAETYLRPGVFVARASLPSGIAATLRATHTNVAFTVNAALSGYATSSNTGSMPPAVIGSTITTMGQNTYVVTINASGVQAAPYNFSSLYTNSWPSLTSDGTTMRAYCCNAAGNALVSCSSTNGTAFTPVTLAGLPTFTPGNWYGNPAANTSSVGEYYGPGPNFALYCGSKWLVVYFSSNGTYEATISSDGVTFGGGAAAAILGSASISNGTHYYWFYRNGLTAFIFASLNGGATQWARKSTDGGATWANVSGSAPTGAAGLVYFRVNASDPTRIIAHNGTGTSAWVTTDSGGTWTAITLPIAATAICGRGSTWLMVAANGLLYQSTNDGGSWNSVATGAGGTISCVLADANRFYALSDAATQILTSTTGSAGAWTLRTLTSTIPASLGGSLAVAATDSNNICISTATYLICSTDGGVNWSCGLHSQGTSGFGARAITTGSSYIMIGSGNVAVSPADMATPAYLRLSASAVSPSKSGAVVYGRIQ